MFREMVRFYRTYRKHVGQAEEEQFQRMVEGPTERKLR
jgi:hypothetical protein